jgi:hypothetical protein
MIRFLIHLLRRITTDGTVLGKADLREAEREGLVPGFSGWVSVKAGLQQLVRVTDRATGMRVHANNDLARAEKLPARTPLRKPALGSDKADLPRTDALNAALKASPEARAEQVARAKALVRDPGYPSDKVLDQVAGVLAKRIRGKA